MDFESILRRFCDIECPVPNYELSENLQRFIATYIVSVEQLEILLLLSEKPDQTWTVAQVFQVIQSSPGSVAERLVNLHQAGFLDQPEQNPPAYRYHPRSPDHGQGVAELRAAYRQSRVKVIETIFYKPMDQAKQFADSFKFRRKK